MRRKEDRKKYWRLVKENPFLRVLHGHLWSQSGLAGLFSVSHCLPEIKFSYLDRNLLLRPLANEYGTITAFGDDWVAERFWAVNRDGRISETKGGAPGASLIERVDPAENPWLYVISEEVYQGHVRGGTYLLALTVLRRHKGFSLKREVRKYYYQRLRLRHQQERARRLEIKDALRQAIGAEIPQGAALQYLSTCIYRGLVVPEKLRDLLEAQKAKVVLIGSIDNNSDLAGDQAWRLYFITHIGRHWDVYQVSVLGKGRNQIEQESLQRLSFYEVVELIVEIDKARYLRTPLCPGTPPPIGARILATIEAQQHPGEAELGK